MADAPAPTPPPRDVTSAALSDVESRTVTELLGYLRENSYAYDQHVELVNLLHKGFIAHVNSYLHDDGRPSTSPPDPHGYSLLAEMRQAREALDSRYAVGEELWQSWLADEIRIATTTEERMNVTELCQKAVQDEPYSTALWLVYYEWVSSNYAACFDLPGSNQVGWDSETKTDCKELFTKETVQAVLEQAVNATKWRIDDSHRIWSHYIQSLLEDFPASPSSADVDRLQSIFLQRMQVPHAEPQEIEQAFWSAISRVQGLEWEPIMAQAKQLAEPAKREMAIRMEDEFALQRALETNDPSTIKAAYQKFLHAEKFRKPRGSQYFELRCASFERALLRFPTATDWWLDYVDYAITAANTAQISLLPLIERATRHCPGSGELWSRRILRADVEQRTREEVEGIKHRATNSGLLDLGGMEEMVKMLQQWCSYLRRHAFRRINEDARDTAEFGIMAALDDIHQAGKKVYGNDFPGDPLFRLEQVQIKFYTESRRLDDARAIYESLAKKPLYAASYDFWNKYYNWELTQWGCELMMEKQRVETTRNGPDRATKVVQKALAQKHLDIPASVLELYLYHFQQHESAQALQTALADSRGFTIRLARQAEKAAQQAAEQQQQQIAAAAAAAAAGVHGIEMASPSVATDTPSVSGGEKRKREDEVPNGNDHKKSKMSDSATVASEDFGKRDREHNTVSVKNLSADTTEKDIREFFTGFGAILAVNLLPVGEDGTAIATVEFESHEDAASSVIRSGKVCNGREVTVHSGGQSVLWVCNYPSEYDEAAIRGLFKHYGEIVNVRFPSLALNSRRRFCYVSFLTADMAKAAEDAMDGKKLDGLHTLTAKISDPNAKRQRSGPQQEGREIFVKNIDVKGSEDEIKAFFAKYGQVESSHLLRTVNGHLTGSAFFAYATAEEANAAVEDANQKPFRDRILNVALSTPKGQKAPLDRMKKQDIIIKQTGSTTTETNGNGGDDKDNNAGNTNATATRRDSDVSMTSSAPGHAAPTAAAANTDESYKTVRERKIAIFDIPDTVNDARIRAAMERYGPITKIQMRREIRGAIVEFVDVKAAFNVRQGVDVSALGEGVRTGDVGDLLQRKKNKAAYSGKGGKGGSDASVNGGAGDAGMKGNPLAFMPSSVAHRSTPSRRGGLGFKRGGSSVAGSSSAASAAAGAQGKAPAEIENGEAAVKAEGESGGAAKSNASTLR